MRFNVVDLETPNRRNDRASEIAIVKMDGTEIIECKSYLVNPEVDFDDFNIDLTGISPDMVRDAPAFPAIWNELGPELASGVFVAHNAPFDLSVLRKCCKAYGLPFQPIDFIDTLEIVRAILPPQYGHRLNEVCDALGIKLDHHHAESDSLACAQILKWAILATGLEPEQWVDTFPRTYTHQRRPHYSDQTLEINDLLELLQEAADDGEINKLWVYEIIYWLMTHEDLKGSYPFDRIYNVMSKTLEDGILEPDEIKEIIKVCQELVDPVACAQSCSSLDLEGKLVCLSGDFEHGSKGEIASLLESKGAVIKKSVVKKLDYLIVGAKGNDAWITGNYGTKIKKAMELQAKGAQVQIVKEADLFACIG